MVPLPVLVNSLRTQRAHMVQTYVMSIISNYSIQLTYIFILKDQYKFIYETLLNRYYVKVTLHNSEDLKRDFEHLISSKDEDSSETYFQQEYKVVKWVNKNRHI